jgi:ACS family allantoate permease-like MFS transporter
MADNDKTTDQIVNTVDHVSDETAVVYHIDPAEEARVLRRIDWCVMPAMVTCFFFQFLDKQTINYASVFGLSEDLNLSGKSMRGVL